MQIKTRAQRLTFPKHSNISAASTMELVQEVVLDVRYAYTSADSVMWLAFRLIEARLDSPPHRSLGIGSGFGPISASMSRITSSILGPPAACIVLRMSACRRGAGAGGGRAADPGQTPAWESSPGAWSSLSSAGFMGSPSESESERRHTATKLRFKRSIMQRCCLDARYEQYHDLQNMLHILHIYAKYAIYAVYAQYAPLHILHILCIFCISSIRAPGLVTISNPGHGAYLQFL